jgi:hypothetical protein
LGIALTLVNDFFGKTVPFITGGAFASPFCGLIATIGAKKGRF